MWMTWTGVGMSTVQQSLACGSYGLMSVALVVIWPISSSDVNVEYQGAVFTKLRRSRLIHWALAAEPVLGWDELHQRTASCPAAS
jgi:hypothetical protein